MADVPDVTSKPVPMLLSSDPAAIAAAETAKARISAAYMMAMQSPRNEMQARSRILDACKNPEFARSAEYHKPVGKQKISGPSVRLAELAVREWGNILTETQVVYEDDNQRRIKFTAIDLETNATHSKEIVIPKTVERKSSAGRDVLGERTNSYGNKVYIVRATEDEVQVREAAMISKTLRNEGLRLVRSDVISEAIEVARATIAGEYENDPAAFQKKVLDAFSTIGVKPKDIEAMLGHKIDQASQHEIQDLRGIYQSIRDGETTWAEVIAAKNPDAAPASRSEAMAQDMGGCKNG